MRKIGDRLRGSEWELSAAFRFVSNIPQKGSPAYREEEYREIVVV